MGDKVGVAVIGVGGIVLGQHLKHLAAMPGVQMAGYLKNQSGRAEQAVQLYGGRLYQSVDQIADDSAVQAVLISTPPFAHGEMELQLIAAGKALLIEKPIGVDLQTVERIAVAAEAKGIVTSIGYHWRYHSSVDVLRATLATKPVIGGAGFWCGSRPGVWWWRDRKTSGGQAVEQTTHIFDLANYLLGCQPVSVFAGGRSLGVYNEPTHTVDDISTALVTYENGATLAITSSDVMGDAAARVSLELFTVGGRHELTFDGVTSRDERGVVQIPNEGNPYQRLNETFIRAVATGDRSGIRSDYASGLLTHRVTMAAERSIASGAVESI